MLSGVTFIVGLGKVVTVTSRDDVKVVPQVTILLDQVAVYVKVAGVTLVGVNEGAGQLVQLKKLRAPGVLLAQVIEPLEVGNLVSNVCEHPCLTSKSGISNPGMETI